MHDMIIRSDERQDVVNERLSLIRKTDGLTFGTDAYLLAAFLRPAKRGIAVELGAGTGIISMLCATKEYFRQIFAVEVQEDFAELASRNVALNGLGDQVKICHKDLRLFRVEDVGAEAEVVFANPPYMRTDSGKRNDSDYKYIARHEVLGGVGDFCAAASRLLKHGGKFYCVWRPDRLSELMASLAAHRLEPKIMLFVHADEESEPSMVLVSATKGGSEGLRILPPLFLHRTEDRGAKKRELSERAQKIYDTMRIEYGTEKGKDKE